MYVDFFQCKMSLREAIGMKWMLARQCPFKCFGIHYMKLSYREPYSQRDEHQFFQQWGTLLQVNCTPFSPWSLLERGVWVKLPSHRGTFFYTMVLIVCKTPFRSARNSQSSNCSSGLTVLQKIQWRSEITAGESSRYDGKFHPSSKSSGSARIMQMDSLDTFFSSSTGIWSHRLDINIEGHKLWLMETLFQIPL